MKIDQISIWSSNDLWWLFRSCDKNFTKIRRLLIYLYYL